MGTLSFQDSFGLMVADYDKYSNDMAAQGKKPVSLMKYALGNF